MNHFGLCWQSINIRQDTRRNFLLFLILMLLQLTASPMRADSSQTVRSSYGPPETSVLYEEDPTRVTVGSRHLGKVIWHTETVKREVSQQADIALRADVDVPDRNFKMTMLIFRNIDVSDPASHTIELSFILPPDFGGTGGGVDDVSGILMKPGEQGRGVSLSGSVAKVADGLFRVNLSNIDEQRSRNLQLLKEATWFSIGLVYHKLHRAVITFEKGKSGYQVSSVAF